MAASPIFTFKAGRCTLEGRKVTPDPTPGWLYLYIEDDFPHLCWRPRTALAADPSIDLLMIPQDGQFYPLLSEEGAEELHSPTNGRVYVLKFESSGQRHFFWMQSKTQSPTGDPSWFSERDLRIGQVVNALLQGDEDLNVESEIQELRRSAHDGQDDADAMEVDQDREETGGAGADATGGDVREEGEASREGGEDGGRAGRTSSAASQDTSAIVQQFLNSLKGGSAGPAQQLDPKPYTTLPDLLPPAVTTQYISTASPQQINHLCTFLPPELFVLAYESEHGARSSDEPPVNPYEALQALTSDQKRDIIQRVLHSPQLSQSLGSLTAALREGGLPMIGGALGLKLVNGGRIPGGSMPLGGDDAVEAFVESVKKAAEDEEEVD